MAAAYGQSKTANALMPGAIQTNLQRYVSCQEAAPPGLTGGAGVAEHALGPEPSSDSGRSRPRC